jgi:hypothetical protein
MFKMGMDHHTIKEAARLSDQDLFHHCRAQASRYFRDAHENNDSLMYGRISTFIC